MAVTVTVAVAIAAVLDRVFAEPPARVHPVALFGRAIGPFDREWSHPVAVGTLVAVALPVLAAGIVAGATWSASLVSPWVGVGVAALALFSTTSLQMLVDTTATVVSATATDVETARVELRALAGRDPSSLSAGEIRSAAVESAAENLADGLVAPLLAFALLAPVSLPLGAGAAAWVKAVNTLDSMLGYHHKPVGTVPARLDDAVMWLPARLSALLLAIAAGSPGVLTRVGTLARRPASPNSGWPMATLATLLGTRLEKPGHYLLAAGPDFPDTVVATRGVRLVSRAGLTAFALTGVVVWF
ncbi:MULTISPECIES: CobD/CbiB family cobalamin biosynthesis protein [Haloferax]|uniref:Probable cobalamin biosynthesis protein CobD n=1 Tax=Haloferax marinum TaxID=2666143 RepID=A0A6A8G550_9EURY|nr:MULTISPECIES: CobD/CbiB family cobalamin biosynthesis protein [Haloferax]KAB1197184.1 cobalamin biosynthesis protein [Haloferax sp. CBA1150]MRW96221.1 CobD/CbiB family cobalamin biosynthesis protein [Haloferax marinum]